MNDIETRLLQALKDLDAMVKTMSTANPKPNLLPLFTQIDELAKHLPRSTDPELLHFLQRKSYDKARARLEGLSIARGSCGR
jgi:hypothetical protein